MTVGSLTPFCSQVQYEGSIYH
ncbi:hypothetical protein SPHINGOR109_50366 [Sphingorhabdus sp. 109]|nr:hypothetical protein SPHINGOR109_50366 [Sphingorhabdus sp. 109]